MDHIECQFQRSHGENEQRAKQKGSTFSLYMVMVISFVLASIIPVTQATRSLSDNLVPLHNNNNNVDEWPMNIDGLFAPEQFDNKAAPVAAAASPSSHFDFFSPLSATSARERLDSAVEYPEFTVLSSTSVVGGARVVLVMNAASYQVVQGSVLGVNATLQVTDLSGVIVTPSYVGSVSLSITVPVAAGTLALNSTTGITFATVTSGEPNITLSGNYATVAQLLTQLKFTARSTAVGTFNITYSLSLAGITTVYINTLAVSVSATPTTTPPTTATPTTAAVIAANTTMAATTPTPTTAPPTTASTTSASTTTASTTSASPTTALPTPRVNVVRIQFSLGSVTSITVNSRAWISQQQQHQPHQRFSPLSTTLNAGTAAFNARLALDICNVTGISAVYCAQRIVVEETFVQNGQTTAVVDFFPLNTTSLALNMNSSSVNLTAVAAAAGGSLSASALANLFVQNNQAWSALPTLSGATISTINVYCAASNSYISLTDTCTAPSSSSSSDTWWIVLVVVLGFFFILAIVIIAVVIQRRQKKPLPMKKVEIDAGKSGSSASSSSSAASSSDASSGVIRASPPPVPAAVPASTSSSEATHAGAGGVVLSTPVGNTATAAAAADQEFPGVQPGLKFMYSAPDWEPESEDDRGTGHMGGAGGGKGQEDVHVDVDEDTRQKRTLKSTLPRKNEDDGNSARFSYVPKDV